MHTQSPQGSIMADVRLMMLVLFSGAAVYGATQADRWLHYNPVDERFYAVDEPTHGISQYDLDPISALHRVQ